MFSPRTRLVGIVVALLLAVAGSAYYSILDPAWADGTGPQNSKLKELLKERHAILKGIAVQAAVNYQSGQASAESVHQANLEVLKAELDLCDSDKERISVLEKIVVLAKKRDEQAAQLAKSNAVSASFLLRAKLDRLEAEIALERARAK